MKAAAYIQDLGYFGECQTCHFPVLGPHFGRGGATVIGDDLTPARTCRCGPPNLKRVTFAPDHAFFVHMRCWACGRDIKRKVTGATLGPLVDPGERCHV